ncbi:unnamed protein product [Calypogeia fissa]
MANFVGMTMAVVLVVVLVSIFTVGQAADFGNWEKEHSDISMVTDLPAEHEAGIISHLQFGDILGKGLLVAEFASFALKHGKVYKSLEELQHRFDTFVSNVELIESTNKKGLSYKLGINKFADIPFEEFKQHYLGAQQECSATKGNHRMSNALLPETKDWRLHDIVSPVKNQKSCGSCWTFSTTGALEAAHAQATGHMVLLSEQQLVDCAGDFNNFGCNGGLPSQAFEYVRYRGGLDTEESYPYKAEDYTCTFDPKNVGATVYDVVNITEGAEYELKDAVGFSRPVSVCYEVVNDFYLYVGGVYTSTNCHDRTDTVNHAVLAVGYDVAEDGMPYWIIKNSWGLDWGVDGYFNMEMGKNMCGVAVCASYPVVPEELLR